jgi:hypothetical protein
MYSIGPAKHSPHLTAILEAVVELAGRCDISTIGSINNVLLERRRRALWTSSLRSPCRTPIVRFFHHQQQCFLKKATSGVGWLQRWKLWR